MPIRKLHKLLGFALLLPFIAWSATALFFLLRPAYADAYARLDVQQYPLEQPLRLNPLPEWRELRYLRSVLGPHLLVRGESGWQQLDPATLQERPWPDADSLRRLLEDAMRTNPQRYGQLVELDGRRMRTDTGVEIQLDWDTLSFSQQGADTRWIDRIYNIHYLRWTGVALLDEMLGVAGLLLLMLMTWTGTRLLLGRNGARAAAVPRSLERGT